MAPDLFLAFAAAILMLIPGPNVALIAANSVAHGPKYGLITVAGTSSAMAIQLCMTALGMTEVLGAFGAWFEWLRWLGVGYLIYLGIAQWRSAAIDMAKTNPEPKSAWMIYTRGFLVSLTNPKTLFFYSAFFPQFVIMNDHIGMQIALLTVILLSLALLIDGAWALLAGHARGLLSAHGHLRNRLSGGFLIGAGAALAFARNR
jgi:homoserine/homoserine lactone efflux protein